LLKKGFPLPSPGPPPLSLPRLSFLGKGRRDGRDVFLILAFLTSRSWRGKLKKLSNALGTGSGTA
ncbi:hypothetical protein, partial [uncultured Bilophila sp.]|uniref:hypothetical protein n=1 Tax=uncultured Bilophila sp. TaxID=529385 RepID=UPI002647C618